MSIDRRALPRLDVFQSFPTGRPLPTGRRGFQPRKDRGTTKDCSSGSPDPERVSNRATTGARLETGPTEVASEEEGIA